MGVSHVSNVSGDTVLDYVPVDICVKGMIITAWKTWRERAPVMPIYNACGLKKATVIAFQRNTIVDDYPPKEAIMYYDHYHIKCRYLGWVVRIVEQIIPALVIDGLLKVTGQRTK
jgi:hypothetical protein